MYEDCLFTLFTVNIFTKALHEIKPDSLFYDFVKTNMIQNKLLKWKHSYDYLHVDEDTQYQEKCMGLSYLK